MGKSVISRDFQKLFEVVQNALPQEDKSKLIKVVDDFMNGVENDIRSVQKRTPKQVITDAITALESQPKILEVATFRITLPAALELYTYAPFTKLVILQDFFDYLYDIDYLLLLMECKYYDYIQLGSGISYPSDILNNLFYISRDKEISDSLALTKEDLENERLRLFLGVFSQKGHLDEIVKCLSKANLKVKDVITYAETHYNSDFEQDRFIYRICAAALRGEAIDLENSSEPSDSFAENHIEGFYSTGGLRTHILKVTAFKDIVKVLVEKNIEQEAQNIHDIFMSMLNNSSEENEIKSF